MHDVDMKVVVGGLIVHIELQLILLKLRVRLHSSSQELRSHVIEPANMLLLQISQTPNVVPFYQSQQMQSLHRLPVPIEVGQHQDTFVTISTFWGPVDHIFDFCLAIYNIPHPIESSLCVSLLLQIRSYILPVYSGRLLHDADALLTILLQVFFGCRVEQVDLEVSM